MKAPTLFQKNTLLTLGLIVVVLSLALFAYLSDQGNWTVADWISMLIAIAVGIYFFILSLFVGNDAQKRARAVANAALITSAGSLGANGARSILGSAESALKVSVDSRAALQHCRYADPSARKDLLEAIVDAYNDLMFSIFFDGRSSSRSVFDRLVSGVDDVVVELRKVATRDIVDDDPEYVQEVIEHLKFIRSLSKSVRQFPWSNCGDVEVRSVEFDWGDGGGEAVGRAPDQREEYGEAMRKRLARLEMLYRRELTVAHNWSKLSENARFIDCRVEIVDCLATADWAAPWYVADRGDGIFGPVSYDKSRLAEQSEFDTVEVRENTPVWPSPVRHGSLPAGLRESEIEKFVNFIDTQNYSSIVVLVYELGQTDDEKRSTRLVLDGNHRLAAARRKAQTSSGNESAVLQNGHQVIAFVIREIGLDGYEGICDSSKVLEGFNPDVDQLKDATMCVKRPDPSSSRPRECNTQTGPDTASNTGSFPSSSCPP